MFPSRCHGLAIAVVCSTILPLAMAQSGSPKLHSAVAHAMTGHVGTAVVAEVHTGRLLAAYHLEVAARRVAYPGSTIKPFTLIALLEGGKVDATTTLMCKREVAIAGHNLNCSHPATGQPLDPKFALAYSCNSYFTTVATRLSPLQLRESFINDGFNTLTGLAKNEVQGNIDLAGSPEQLQLQAIGEWGVKVTPLELLQAYRHLALLQTQHDSKLAPVLDGLQASVALGMGQGAQPLSPMKVAGKTGTARSEEGSWTHAWFAGYAPAEDPEIVLIVFLEKGRGGIDAAQVARQIFAAFAADRLSLIVPAAFGAAK